MLQIRTPSSERQQEVNINIDKFNAGSNSLVDVARQRSDMAYEATNLMQDQDGVWTTRWGTAYYGLAIPGEDTIDGIGVYVGSRGTTSETRELIAVGGTTGAVYKSTDGSSWTQVGVTTLTVGYQTYFAQWRDQLYITNSYDTPLRYDGSSLLSYTSLSAPALAGTPLTRTTLTTGSYTYYYQATALNDVGETVGSTEASITVNKLRDNWTGGEGLTFDWNSVVGASRYQVYISDQSGFENLLTATTDTQFFDDGSIEINPYVEVPLSNTTTAPRFGPMDISGNRAWATKDKDNPYRVHGSGVGQYATYFNPFYGGFYVDIEKGGQNIPIRVVHYRTGKGDPIATVICSSPDGNGSTFQVSLDQVTVGSTTFIVPTVYKIVGSIGGDAPLGVATPGDNVLFANKKGVFALRNKPQIVNVLSTDELTANIRPTWRALSGANINKIASVVSQGKVLFSVPSGTENDQIIVYDVERNNWSVAWSKGVKQFVEYTDSAGNTHLLGVPATGGRVWEFVDGSSSDLGQPFNTSYLSPLIPVSKDSGQQARINDSYIELGRPQGTVYFEVLGIEKDGQLKVLNSRTISSASSQSQIDFANALWGDYEFSTDEDPAPSALARAREVKNLKIRRKVSALQFHVYSTDANVDYSIYKLQANGYLLPSKPTKEMKD